MEWKLSKMRKSNTYIFRMNREVKKIALKKAIFQKLFMTLSSVGIGSIEVKQRAKFFNEKFRTSASCQIKHEIVRISEFQGIHVTKPMLSPATRDILLQRRVPLFTNISATATVGT